jgi:hypothetical protein
MNTLSNPPVSSSTPKKVQLIPAPAGWTLLLMAPDSNSNSPDLRQWEFPIVAWELQQGHAKPISVIPLNLTNRVYGLESPTGQCTIVEDNKAFEISSKEYFFMHFKTEVEDE